MDKRNSKKHSWFIGIDVSRNELDFAVMKAKTILFHREIPNDIQSIKDFIAELKLQVGFTIGKTIFCMENTGFYSNHLLQVLHRLKANIVVENSMHIKSSLGNIRGKNDKIDAMRIAEYTYTHRENLRFWSPRRPVIDQLAELTALRLRLRGLYVGLTTPVKEQQTFVKKKVFKENVQLCTRSVEAVKLDLSDVEEAILKVINEDEELCRLRDIIVSVDYVGPVTATEMLICTNEFKDIKDPKKFACYAGVAPFPKESGKTKVKSRVSHMANKKMKSLLHMCAVQAMRYSPELRPYYLRKVEQEGKAKMAVMNALRYKLILRIFACVNQNRKFEKTYVNSHIKMLKEIESESSASGKEEKETIIDVL